MFTQAELELLAEALDWRLKHGEFSKSLKTHFNTEAHKIALTDLAEKVVLMQEAEQNEHDPASHDCKYLGNNSWSCGYLDP